MNNDLPEIGTVESLKIMVNTIKQYCLPEYPANDKGQKPFIGVVLDEVVKEIEASICRQETLQETAAAMEKYIYAIPALCRGEEVACALHVSSPIKELRTRIAELEKQLLLAQTKVRTVDAALTARNGELEQMVRELVNTVVQIPTEECVTLSVKALALLQPEAGEGVVR